MDAPPGLAVDSFARQGFAVFPRFLAAAQVAPLRAACDRVLERQRATMDGGDTTNTTYLTDGRWHPQDGHDRLALLEFIASPRITRSEEHTSELQSRGLISYAVFFLKK